MNLSPAPFGLEDTILRAAPPAPIKGAGPGGSDRTECNYLVMFFVLGVFMLAFMDSV
jgi:hypothetical protein